MSDTSQNVPSEPAGGSPAAPASSSPAGAGTGRPTSASSAMEGAAARSAAQPATAQPGAKPNGSAAGAGTPAVAATTAQPAKPATVQPQARGSVPTEEHEKAVKNARKKAEDEYAQRYAWANGLDPAEVKEQMELVKRLRGNPKQFASELTAELDGLDDKLPDPDLKSADGKVTAYSAGAVAKIVEQIRNQVMRDVRTEIQPLMSEREKAEKAKQTEAYVSQGKAVIRDAITHARSLPHFQANEKAISAKLGEIPKEVVDKVGLVGAMYMAYSALLSDLMTGASTQGEQKAVEDMKRKAAAGAGAITPGGPTASGTPKKPGNVRELAAHMERLASA